jgi:hypothetical protein
VTNSSVEPLSRTVRDELLSQTAMTKLLGRAPFTDCFDNQPFTAFITSAINCCSVCCHDICVLTDRYLDATIPHCCGCEITLPTERLGVN